MLRAPGSSPTPTLRPRGPRWCGGLLASDEPDPVGHLRRNGTSEVLLVCDHAGRRIPRALGTLGLEGKDLERHCAWDLGALGVSRALSRRLDAELIYQRYSRLVIDCNRPPHVPGAFVTHTDRQPVPGNIALSASDAARRVAELFHPYHARIDASLERRRDRSREAVLVSVHSFTPEHQARREPRPWDVGLLFNRDQRLAEAVEMQLCEDAALLVGRNEPYAVDDDGDYAVPVHGERRGLVHVAFEIRQDLLATRHQQYAWAQRLASCITGALANVGSGRQDCRHQEI